MQQNSFFVSKLCYQEYLKEVLFFLASIRASVTPMA